MILPRQSDVFFEGDGTRRVLICDKVSEQHTSTPSHPTAALPHLTKDCCEQTCETAYIIKWAILLALFGLFFTWLLVGYWHVRARARKGLPPLAYHRVSHLDP